MYEFQIFFLNHSIEFGLISKGCKIPRVYSDALPNWPERGFVDFNRRRLHDGSFSFSLNELAKKGNFHFQRLEDINTKTEWKALKIKRNKWWNVAGSNIPDKNSKLVLYHKKNLSKLNFQKSWMVKPTTVQKIWMGKTIPAKNTKPY